MAEINTGAVGAAQSFNPKRDPGRCIDDKDVQHDLPVRATGERTLYHVADRLPYGAVELHETHLLDGLESRSARC